MIKKFFVGILMVMFAGFLVLSCFDDERDEVSIPDIDGLWDLLLVPLVQDIVTYTVEVTAGGLSGNAQVTTNSSEGDDSGPDVVFEGTPIVIGGCSVTITFSDTAGFPLDLALGDQWAIQVRDGLIYNPGAAKGNSSTVDSVTSGGTYACQPDPCMNGLFEAGVPGVAQGQAELMAGQVEFPALDIDQENANFAGLVPEIYVLSLTLLGHSRGDEIDIRFHRKIHWDGDGGDFFRARVFDGNTLRDIEYVNASNLSEKDAFISSTFKAEGSRLRVDFIFGLSGPDDRIRLDEVSEKVNGAVAFSDNFTTSAFQDDLAGDDVRWEARTPSEMAGMFVISANDPLEGTYSVLAQGGETRSLSGSILTTTNVLGLGLLSGLSGTGGGGGISVPDLGEPISLDMDMDPASISNVTFSIVEGTRSGFYSSFGGALEDDDLLIGTFKGEEGDHSCVEEGQFFATINNNTLLKVDGNWILGLTGEAQNCGEVGQFTQSLGPFQVNQNGEWISSDPAALILDEYGNSYIMQGRTYGQILYFLLGDANRVSTDTAYFFGTKDEEIFMGGFGGGMFFNNGRVCDVSGTFTLTVN